MGISLDGKVAVITGASRGIGRAIAKRLARENMKLFLTARSFKDLKDVKDEVETEDNEIFIYTSDLREKPAARDIISNTIDRYNRLDVLINNAGIAHKSLLEETTVEEWDLHMAVNVRAPFLLCKNSIPYLEKSEIGKIVNIASVVASKGYKYQGAYTASKHALLGFSKVLAKEIDEKDIEVHAISPGGVATELLGNIKPKLDPGDLISPGEIAEVIVFLLTKLKNGVIDEVNIRRHTSTPWE